MAIRRSRATIDAKIALEQAQEFRNASVGRDGGWVILWRGLVQGWSDPKPEASGWRPETIIIDANGVVFMAIGGTDQDGAREWVCLED